MINNILTCQGFGEQASNFVGGTGCIKARLGIVFLFFIIAIMRRWGGEEIGLNFSFLFGLIGGLISYLIVVSITGNFKWALGLGLLLAIAGGYGGGLIFEGGGEE